MYRDWP